MGAYRSTPNGGWTATAISTAEPRSRYRPMTETSSTSVVAPDLTITTFPVASPDSDHVFCCVNEDISLCAQDISAHTVKDKQGPSGCRVCDYLDETPFCPLGLICEETDDA